MCKCVSFSVSPLDQNKVKGSIKSKVKYERKVNVQENNRNKQRHCLLNGVRVGGWGNKRNTPLEGNTELNEIIKVLNNAAEFSISNFWDEQRHQLK